MTQCERIVQYIQDWGSITSFDAFMDLGITRLSARIFDLTRQGYRFKVERVSKLNRYGEKVSYNKYSLVEEQK